MKSVTSFLLGTAALIATSSVALAADVDPLAPVAAKAFEPPPPVPNCADKKGYFIVPNTQTCLKVLGMIRAQVHIHESNVSTDSWDGVPGPVETTPQTNDTWSMGTAARFGADTVTETDFGTLRGNIMLQADGGTSGDTAAALRYAFVTFGGFTAGHTDSFFTPDGALGGYGTAVGDYGGIRRSLLGYTANFTDEVSASIAIEDHDNVDGGDGAFGGPTAGSNADILLVPADPTRNVINESTQLPDLVGNVVGKFDWGLLFASGVVGNYRTREETTFIPHNFVGWAVGAGGNLKLDGLAKGDGIQEKVGYSDGASGYIGAVGDHAIIDTVGPVVEALTTASWTAQGSFLHNWSPTWSSTVYGGVAGASRTASTDPTVEALLNDKLTLGWNIAGNLQWSPVENYIIGGEVFYANATKENISTGEYTADAIGSIVRVQRDF